MNTYEIIVIHYGVPYETWEVETETPERAAEVCRAERMALGEHDPGDSYRTIGRPNDLLECLHYDAALALAYHDACKRMPALAELGSKRLLGYSLTPSIAVTGLHGGVA